MSNNKLFQILLIIIYLYGIEFKSATQERQLRNTKSLLMAHGGMFCNNVIRNRYCKKQNKKSQCLRCDFTPACPTKKGFRVIPPNITMLMRGISSKKYINNILTKLNNQRKFSSWAACVPLFQWNTRLAKVAQSWVDQCALVTHHISRVRQGKAKNPDSIAQTLHWVQSNKRGFSSTLVNKLFNSTTNTFEENDFTEGLFVSLGQTQENNLLAWGHATHVGCGWIQFPVNKTKFENYLLCRYATGYHSFKTSCKDDRSSTAYIIHYRVPSSTIEDVKLCLKTVACTRKQNCSKGDLDLCLRSRSGLALMSPLKGRNVSSASVRAGDVSPMTAAVEAAKCKIETILCRLNGDCHRRRLTRCQPLLLSQLQCEYAANGLVLDSDNRRSNCSHQQEKNV